MKERIEKLNREIYLFLIIYCRKYKAKLPSEWYTAPPCRSDTFLLKRDNINFEIKISIQAKNGDFFLDSFYFQNSEELNQKMKSRNEVRLQNWINETEKEIGIEDRVKRKYKIKD
jgi:hypothetical protein